MTTSIKILKTIKPPLRWVPEQGDFTTDFCRASRKTRTVRITKI